MIDNKNIRHLIDYTNLDDMVQVDDIKDHCLKALQYNVKAVCIWPQYVIEAKAILKYSSIKVCTVISFPLGKDKKEQKETQTYQAIVDGVDEIDMVFNYQLFIDNWQNNTIDKQIRNQLIEEILSIAQICHSSNVLLKVILESGVLTIPQTIETTKICIEGGVDFIKTSTGKGGFKGAELDKVKAIRETINSCNAQNYVSIKISGGIQMDESTLDFIALGIQRIGIGYKKYDDFICQINNLKI